MSGGIKLITATMEENVSKAGLKSPADSVREYLDKLGITEQDLADAVLWARSSPRLELQQVVNDIAAALVTLDASGRAFKTFQPGAGPYGEPQLVRAIADFLNGVPAYQQRAKTKRTPDLLIAGEWALEFKIARPFGDNGKEAENWSVNLLHPYEGNVSVIGDCMKLQRLNGPELKAVVVVGYEHTPPRIPLSPLFDAFACVATQVLNLKLGQRVEVLKSGLRHPVHQQVTVVAWEVLS